MTEQQESEKQTSRFGHKMILAAFGVGLGLLTVLFQYELDSHFNPNRTPKVISENGQDTVILKRNRYGHYVANGKINGHDVVFLVDTGATTVAMPDELAEQLGLQQGKSYISSTAAGNVISFRTMLDSVTLGSITVNQVRGAIIPDMDRETILLGMSFLNNLEITQRDGLMTLKVPRD